MYAASKFKEKFKVYLNFLLPGFQKNRLIIVSRSRSGSNNLKSILNQSSDIAIAGEVFGSVKSQSEINQLIKKYIKKSRLAKYSGFKFFYYHPVNWNQRIWSDVISRNTKIIILVRRNMIKAEISRQRSLQSGIWIEQGYAQSNVLHKFDAEKIASEVNKAILIENEFIDFVLKLGCDFQIIEFEKIISDPKNEINKICRFLNIKQYRFNVKHRKTNNPKINIMNETEIEQTVEEAVVNVRRTYQSYI